MYFDNPVLFSLSNASSTKAFTTLKKNPNIKYFQLFNGFGDVTT